MNNDKQAEIKRLEQRAFNEAAGALVESNLPQSLGELAAYLLATAQPDLRGWERHDEIFGDHDYSARDMVSTLAAICSLQKALLPEEGEKERNLFVIALGKAGISNVTISRDPSTMTPAAIEAFRACAARLITKTKYRGDIFLPFKLSGLLTSGRNTQKDYLIVYHYIGLLISNWIDLETGLERRN